MRKFGYCRVSSAYQAENSSLECQRDQLVKHGVDPSNIFSDVYTGTELERPELSKLLNIVQPGDFIFVTRLDRFARNLLQALNLIADLKKRNICLISLDIPGSTDPTIHELIFIIILYFAQYEHERRKLRQQEGIEKAKLNGKYKGRKTKITEKLKKDIKKYLYTRNYTKEHAAECLGISRSTLYKALREIESEEAITVKNH